MIIDFRLLIVSFVVNGLLFGNVCGLWFVVWDVRVSQAKRAERSGLLLSLVYRRSPATFQNQKSCPLIFLWFLSAVRDLRQTDKEMKKKDNYFIVAKNSNNLFVAKVPNVTCDISKSKKLSPNFSLVFKRGQRPAPNRQRNEGESLMLHKCYLLILTSVTYRRHV